MIDTKLLISAALLPALLAATGCVHTRPDFGDAVRHTTAQQLANPDAAIAPDPNPVQQGDGPRLQQVLEVYRTDVGAPEVIRQEIIIGIQ